MNGNKSSRGDQDRNLINTSEDYEVLYWSEKFGVSTDELREAVSKAGSISAHRVEQYIKRNR